MERILAETGRAARDLLAFVGGVSRLAAALAFKLLKLARLNLRLFGKVALNQVRFSGVGAVPLVALVAAFIGGVAIIQSFNRLTGLAPDLIGTLLVTIIVRELGPLITAVILIGRSGTAIAAEIGSMRLNGEIEALKAYRIDPVDFVVLPRVLGMILAMFSLLVVFDLFGILGGFGIAAMLQDISFSLLESRVLSALTNADIVFSVLKALLFGSAISILPSYFGLAVRKSPTELPQAVTKAVVASMACVVFLDGAIAAAFYLL